MIRPVPLDASAELPQPSTGDAAFSDGLTFAFGDLEAGVHGVVRVGHAAGGASGLAIAYLDGAPRLVQLEGGVPLARAPERLDEVAVAGIDHEILEPLRRWSVSVAADDGALDLVFTAVGAPVLLPSDSEASQWSGGQGYEQFCVVTGTAHLGGRRIAIAGRGQRGHQWGAPDWSRMSLSRTVSGWLSDGTGFTLVGVRPQGAEHHADEVARASLWTPRRPGPDDGAAAEGTTADAEGPAADGEDEDAVVVDEEPRLSTSYDADGRHPRASLELWASDEGPVWRASGEAVAGTEIDLGRLRLQTAAYRWRLDGHEGVGRYDVLRRVDEPDPPGAGD